MLFWPREHNNLRDKAYEILKLHFQIDDALPCQFVPASIQSKVQALFSNFSARDSPTIYLFSISFKNAEKSGSLIICDGFAERCALAISATATFAVTNYTPAYEHCSCAHECFCHSAAASTGTAKHAIFCFEGLARCSGAVWY